MESNEIKCPCCGHEMVVEAVHENHLLYKCNDCGLSDVKLRNSH